MMKLNLLNLLTVNPAPFSERAKEAGLVALMGMTAIFSVLALLWLMIEILHRLLAEKKPAPKTATVAPIKSKKSEKDVKSAEPVVEPKASDDDCALIAVITAAVSAAMAAEGYNGGFRVVSFKRSSVRKGGRG